VQRKLAGCRPVPAVDLRVGCAAILYSVQLAQGLIASGQAETVACFGAEAQSKGLDLSPSSAELSMLFGDGAGAVIVGGDLNSNRDRFALRIEDILLATDGHFAGDLIVRAPGTGNGARWLTSGQLVAGLHYGSMNGRSVILHAVRKLADAAAEITRRNGLALDDIDLVVPHQANGNLLLALSRKLSLPGERIISNVDRFGNTGGASAFIALCQAYKEERLRLGAAVLILAFGAGFTWGAMLCRVTGD
jgi:3-oxoacyl-[acyl-carrier-protein] synthase-3